MPVFFAVTRQAMSSEAIFVTSAAGAAEALGEDFGGAEGPPGIPALSTLLEVFFRCGGRACYVVPLISISEVLGPRDALAPHLANRLAKRLPQLPPDSDIIAIPQLPMILDDVNTILECVWVPMLALCAANQGPFALLDLPAEPAAAEAIWYRTSDFCDTDDVARTYRFAAAYWPWVRVPVRSLGEGTTIIEVPPSTAMAALYQKVDSERGIWTAPANVALPFDVQPAIDVTDIANEYWGVGSSRLDVNLILDCPGRGVRSWGARTLAPRASAGDEDESSVFSYIQAQRLLIFVQRTLRTDAGFCVFEPNNEITWSKMHAAASVFLRRLWQAGALPGHVEDEAFRVAIGLGETMTKGDIDQGIIRLHVELAFHAPAEFIAVDIEYLNQTALVS